MEGSSAKAISTADDHGVAPEQVRKTRSKNPLKWFRRECKCSASSSSSVPPKAGVEVSKNETKEKKSQPAASSRSSVPPKAGVEVSKNETKEKKSQPAAPIQRSSAPLVVNYFPSEMPLSRR
jgi:hypothetical protein